MALRALQGPTGGGSPVGGTGTTNTIPRWTGPSTLGDSIITQSGTLLGVNKAVPTSTFDIDGLQANTGASSVSSPTGTLRLNFAGAPNAGDFGASAVFSQQWAAGSPTSYVAVGQITGVKTAGSGSYGGGLAFFYGPFGLSQLREGFRLDQSGNVGIGTASPGALLHLSSAATTLRVTSTTATNAGIVRIEAAGGNIYVGRDSSAGGFSGVASSSCFIDSLANPIVLGTSSSERMRISGSAAQVAIGTSSFTSGCSLTVAQSIDASQSAQGVKLQGTAGTNNTDPNVLDFYADGGTANSGGVTWTPELRFGGATTGITYTTRVGRYTRVGNTVIAHCYVLLSSKGSATGNVTIAGLPTSSNTSGLFASVTIGYISGVSFTNQMTGYIGPNQTEVSLFETTNAGALSTITDADFTATSGIMFTVSYPVT